MMTWTITSFEGHWPVGCAAVVTADDVETACRLLERELAVQGLSQTIRPEQLVPFVTSTRYVRILNDGNY